jgi:SAM-dependent methyltransferase
MHNQGFTGAQSGVAAKILQCPKCHRSLTFAGGMAICSSCQRAFPLIDGIIDLSLQCDKAMPHFYNDFAYQRFAAGAALHHAIHYRPGSLSGRIEEWIKVDLMRLFIRLESPIVDLGCGTGSGFNQFGGASRIIGVDSNLELLRTAKRVHPAATLICAPLERLPFLPGTIKTIVANAVIEHVFRLDLTMESIAKCLASDGFLYMGVPAEGGLLVSLARFVTSQRNAAIYGLTAKESRRAQRLDHCNTIFAIENAMRKHFIIEKQAGWPFGIGSSLINLTKSYRLRPIHYISVSNQKS